MNDDLIQWFMECDEPWTRYRTMIDLQGLDDRDPEASASRQAMVDHPQIKSLIEVAASWPGYGLKRHNDAKHPLHAIATLADFGLNANDPGMKSLIERITAHQDEVGFFQTYSHLYERFAGIGGEHWTWMMCDAPTLLYGLLEFGMREDPQVVKAIEYLQGIIRENGWPCAGGAPLKPSFKGPGKREDPCPYANLIALKALSQIDNPNGGRIQGAGIEVLLQHWDHAYDHKLYLFGTGSKFRNLKYPFVWYDILHVADVLSLYPEVHGDARYQAMLTELREMADGEGKYTATSMYQAWKGWSFADKKHPSPWITFLVQRLLQRVYG